MHTATQHNYHAIACYCYRRAHLARNRLARSYWFDLYEVAATFSDMHGDC
jgi:hypothetical protein